MLFAKLYANASNGKIKTWEIEADNDTMIIHNGYEGGKIATQTKKIVGKSVGKSNETTASEQCILECKSKWQKKIDEQYTMDKNNIKSYSDQKVLLPMLALDYHKRSKDIKFPCYIQPKLNGVRCIYQGNKFISRKGKEYTTLAHLVPELKALGIDIPDGEIYVHGMSFQEIIRRVKKNRGSDTQALEYWIYDQINPETFERRTEEISVSFGLLPYSLDEQTHKVKYVPTILVNTKEEIKKWHDKWVQEGFEGVIIRNDSGLYKVKHRSKDLQKYKEFIDEEFEVVGGHEGSGPDAGTVVFEVKTKSNKVFSVRPKGTREERTEWFNDIKKIIGKELTVRYQNLSEEGIPIFPVGVSIRDYE
jgi:ATP-dependent DNA ligase